jgi:hypothetical protein
MPGKIQSDPNFWRFSVGLLGQDLAAGCQTVVGRLEMQLDLDA